MKYLTIAILLISPWFAVKSERKFPSAMLPMFKVSSRPAMDVSALIQAAAWKHKVKEAFVKSIVAVESNFNSQAVSPKGAIGLMQLMPETASQYGVDPTIPEQNIDGGTRYLRYLLAKYRNHRHGLQCAIAAYNAGPGMVDKYRGIPPFRETRMYVARVLKFLQQFESRRG
jgi:soluble lytic murein transglycosylase-like protein